MISGRDIICISSIEWDFLWQGHQEITSRLAQAGNRVLYIENTGVRAPGIRDAGRLRMRLKKWIGSLRSNGVREVAPNIYVCSPLVLPPFGSHWQRQTNRRFLLPFVRRTARSLGMRDILIWTYLPTDTALDLIHGLAALAEIIVYYCIADFAQLTPHVHRLRQSEKTLIESSDLVFAQGPELAAHCLQWSNKVHIFPFGVSLDAFPLTDTAAPTDGRSGLYPSSGPSLRRPIIGYVGGLHRHVDFGLLVAMARARPEWSWAFAGPIQTEVGDLGELPNVYLLGQQPHHKLVRYIGDFDVCIVPYVNSLYTATVVPTKINEYLAVGKPVVSTELPAVCEFNKQHKILQTAATQPDDFLQAIEQSLLLPTDKATAASRREVAMLGNWETRLEAMSKLIEIELQRKAVAQDRRVKACSA
ncbi:MAG: glycosyltransferase [Pyrinomonadaceae bacterium]